MLLNGHSSLFLWTHFRALQSNARLGFISLIDCIVQVKGFFRSSTALSEFFFRFLYFIFLPGALKLKARPAQLSQAVAVKCHSRQFASSSLRLAIHKPIATIATSELDSALNAKSILLSHKEWRNNLCLIDVFTYCNHRYKRDRGRSMGVMEGNCGHDDTRVHNGVAAWITCFIFLSTFDDCWKCLCVNRVHA